MIHTDGRPTIAWAAAEDIDPLYQVMERIYDKFESGEYRWQPNGGPPSQDEHRPSVYKICIGIACTHTNRYGDIIENATYDDNVNKASFEALMWIAETLSARHTTYPLPSLSTLYKWNDTLDSKSAKRSILRLLKRAMDRRREHLTK